MINDSGVFEGQLYELFLEEEEGAVLATYEACTREKGEEPHYVFSQKFVNAPIIIAKSVYDQMRSDGRANLVVARKREARVEEIDPLALLDPDDKNITLKERDRRLLARQRLLEARTLRFYCVEYDSRGNVGLGSVGVRRFIKEYYQEAEAAGFEWEPSPGALIRAVKGNGTPGNRPLSAFFDNRGKHDREVRWPKEVIGLAGAVITWHWEKRHRRPIDAVALFNRAFRLLKVRRAKSGRPVTPEDPFPKPHDKTIVNWINKSSSYWNYVQKYGEKQAHRRLGGRRRSIIAHAPLELVMMDHTQIDLWSAVLDENGRPVAAGRLWMTYAIDVYSRMVLGAHFSYEHPSVNSVMECLRQVIRRKKFLIDEYGFHKGATDGYGQPTTLIVDNGWEFVGTSFQTACEMADIDVMWAPVKTPMFKAYVEVFFDRVNDEVWHRMEGGIPLTPRDRSLLELDPSEDAVHDRERVEALFWRFVVTRYHVEVHSNINAAPALKWRKGISQGEGRPLPARVDALDGVLGITFDALLTAEGITFRGQRFHDPATTTRLMGELVQYAKSRNQRKNVTSSRSVEVVCTASAGNADFLKVHHPEDKTTTALPNWDPYYKTGTSWYVLDKIKSYAQKENLAFHTHEEQAEARAAFIDAIEAAPFVAKFATRARLAPFRDPTPQLVPGDEVETIDLTDEDDIPQMPPGEHRKEPIEVSHSVRRGGVKATRKMQATKKEKKLKKKAEEQAAELDAQREEDARPNPDRIDVVDSAEDRLAELRRQLDEGN